MHHGVSTQIWPRFPPVATLYPEIICSTRFANQFHNGGCGPMGFRRDHVDSQLSNPVHDIPGTPFFRTTALRESTYRLPWKQVYWSPTVHVHALFIDEVHDRGPQDHRPNATCHDRSLPSTAPRLQNRGLVRHKVLLRDTTRSCLSRVPRRK